MRVGDLNDLDTSLPWVDLKGARQRPHVDPYPSTAKPSRSTYAGRKGKGWMTTSSMNSQRHQRTQRWRGGRGSPRSLEGSGTGWG